MLCKVHQDIISVTKQIKLTFIEGSLEEQKAFIKSYEKYLVLREEILKDSEVLTSLPGLNTAPPKRTAARRHSGDI